MADVDLETLATIVAMTIGLFGLYFMLRRQLRSEISDLRSEFRSEIGEVKAHVVRLDDRVYALAVGMKPLIDEVRARTHEA